MGWARPKLRWTQRFVRCLLCFSVSVMSWSACGRVSTGTWRDSSTSQWPWRPRCPMPLLPWQPRSFLQVNSCKGRGSRRLMLRITWGKVVSMYAVAGALAVDCVRQNQPATVQTIVDSLGQFVRKNLAPWLKKRGGWTDIKKCVVKLDAVPQTHWLSPVAESCKHFLSTLYIYIMKEP
ncbi:bcl-2-related ovarian killer protein homolog A-like isoform 2-T3 [Salvelinus alpinus]